MIALQNPALRPGLCITHIGDDPIAGISQDASKKLMQNQQSQGALTLSFRALPSPWATDRKPEAEACCDTEAVEPEPEQHRVGALHVDESIPVDMPATTTDML